MYILVHAACGFLNLLKVDMFLKPTDIKTKWAATNNSPLYTTEGEVLDEFHGLPHMNPSFIILNVGYYVFTSLNKHFTNMLRLH